MPESTRECSRELVVFGARGLIGRAAVEHFERRPGWSVTGVARQPPDFDTRADWIRVDLRDRAACETALAGLRGVTHVAYAALYEQPQLAAGWREPEHVAINLAMLRNALDPLERAAPGLEHVCLLQGTKAYGAHLGRMRVPARERWPRVEHPNFYFAQEDELRARQARGAGFALSILRPQIVCGIALGSPMNVVAGIGAFASLLRARGEPLFHPGHARATTELVDAALLAEAIEFVSTTPRCAGEIYNVANGDALLWRDLWPSLAEYFGMPLGEPRALCLAQEMPRHAGLWRELARKHGLRATELDALVGASWQYADLTWANALPDPKPALVSTIKLRQAGFHACRDSEEMLIELLARMRRERLLPP
jgi:nucleoside-diphosphate-sugar epimerase